MDKPGKTNKCNDVSLIKYVRIFLLANKEPPFYIKRQLKMFENVIKDIAIKKIKLQPFYK